MIVRINGTPINYSKTAPKPVKSEPFTWQTKKATAIQVRPEASPVPVTEPKTETLRDRLAKIREKAKKHILP